VAAPHATSSASSDGKSELRLGEIFWRGLDGISVDKSEAIRWYRKSEERQHLGAILKLAHIYDFESGAAPDYEEAFRWYKQAADFAIFRPNTVSATATS